MPPTQQSQSPFFSLFPDFTPPTLNASISSAFHHLAHQRQWKKNSKTWKKQWNLCMNLEYDRLIGQELTSLESWRRLCVEVGVEGGGQLQSIKKCKEALSKVFVNMVDLLEARQAGRKVKTFKNLGKLRNYTQQTGRFFSRQLAKQDKLLRVLLRHLA